MILYLRLAVDTLPKDAVGSLSSCRTSASVGTMSSVSHRGLIQSKKVSYTMNSVMNTLNPGVRLHSKSRLLQNKPDFVVSS